MLLFSQIHSKVRDLVISSCVPGQILGFPRVVSVNCPKGYSEEEIGFRQEVARATYSSHRLIRSVKSLTHEWSELLELP